MVWRFELPILLAVLSVTSAQVANTSTTTEKPPAAKLICKQCPCTSSNMIMYAYCGRRELSEFPEITKEINSEWVLELDSNLLTSIDVLPVYKHLTKLEFTFNQISRIADSAFGNLLALQILDLSHNAISTDTLTSDTFTGNYSELLPKSMESLKLLNLSYNQLSSLPERIFVPLPNLTTLDLSNNPFKDLSTKTAATFTDLGSLVNLDLSYTKINRLPAHFFAELRKLKSLDLSGNDFIVVPSEINYAHSLRTLKINDNLFGILGSNSFWNDLQFLEELHLCRSSTLFKIGEGTFGNLTGLKVLHLTGNPQLSMLHSKAFLSSNNSTINLQKVYLQDNALATLSSETLNWDAIDEIDLQRNPWNCDCNFEWVVKSLVPKLVHSENKLTRNITCHEPDIVKGLEVFDARVLALDFVCVTRYSSTQHNFILIATIVVGCLLLLTGVVFFIYILVKKANPSDWIGENVKYRRAQSDENVSTILY